MSDKFFLFDPAGLNPNPLIIGNDNTIIIQDFDTFANVKTENKTFYIPEVLIRQILNNSSNVTLLENYIPYLIANNINILVDISTGEISTNQYNSLLHFFNELKTPHRLLTLLVNTQFEFEILSALSSEISVVCTNRNEILFFDDLYLKKRPKRFLFLSRRFTVERLFIFLDLMRRKILENSFYSFSFIRDPYQNNMQWDDLHIEDLLIKFVNNTRQENKEISHVILDYWNKNKKDLFNNSPYLFGIDPCRFQHDEEVVNKFNESYISLCVETAMHDDQHHFQPSEKIYKCCYYRHPFFVYSTPNFLNHWNHSGYQSFSDVFDESYDDDLDMIGRILNINDQVEKINEMRNYQLIHTLHKCQSVLNHNQKLLTEKFLHIKQKNLYVNKNNITDKFLRNKFIINDYD